MAGAELASYFQNLARYNTIVNERLYMACSELSDGEYRRQRVASFNSIHATLNHILLADRIWMDRFTQPGILGTPPLGTILYDEFDSLRAARAAEDERIEQFMSGLDDTFLRRDIQYLNSKGQLCSDPAPLILGHFFNHQTHHRGQLHVMLSQTAVQRPNFDLHRAIRAPIGAS
jgi:uncharacterized damage-inducible protein DinB